MAPDASFTPGDCQTGKGESNKIKTKLGFYSKGKEQRSTCLSIPAVGFSLILTETENYHENIVYENSESLPGDILIIC